MRVQHRKALAALGNGVNFRGANVTVNTDSQTLTHYNTAILRRNARFGVWILNGTKYSVTTTVLQGACRLWLAQQGVTEYITLDDLPRGVTGFALDCAAEADGVYARPPR